VPLNKELRAALVAMKAMRNGVEAGDRISHSERDIGMSPGAVQVVSSVVPKPRRLSSRRF